MTELSSETHVDCCFNTNPNLKMTDDESDAMKDFANACSTETINSHCVSQNGEKKTR